LKGHQQQQLLGLNSQSDAVWRKKIQFLDRERQKKGRQEWDRYIYIYIYIHKINMEIFRYIIIFLLFLPFYTVTSLSVHYSTFNFMKGHHHQQLSRVSFLSGRCSLQEKEIDPLIEWHKEKQTAERQIYIYIYIYKYNQINKEIERYLDTSQYPLSSFLFIQLDLSQYITPHLTSWSATTIRNWQGCSLGLHDVTCRTKT
jgi:hypothetical protein